MGVPEVKIPATHPPRRRRRLLVILICVVLGLPVAWKIVERIVNVDRFCPQVVAAIEQATGLPASVDDLDLDLFPLPSLDAYAVRVGENDFEARADSVEVRPRLRSLLRGAITVSHIGLDGLRITIPDNNATLAERVRTLQSALSSDKDQSDTGKSGVAVRRIVAESVRLYRGASKDNEPAAVADVELRDVLSDRMLVKGASAVPYLGETARVRVALHILRDKSTHAFAGTEGIVRLRNVDLAALAKNAEAPEAILDLDADLQTEATVPLTFALSGKAVGQTANADSLSGPISARAVWDSGAFRMEDFAWQGRSLTLRANASRSPDGAIACKVSEAEVMAPALRLLLTLTSSGAVRAVPTETTSLNVSGLALAAGAGGSIALNAGNAAFDGIDLALTEETALLSGLRGRAEVREGVLHVTELAGSGFALSGTLRPDFAAKTTVVHLQGGADLAALWPEGPPFPSAIKDLSGHVTLGQVSCTLGTGLGFPPDLVVEATLKDGRVSVESAAFSDDFDPISARFSTETGGISGDMAAESATLGALRGAGRYDFAERQWEGAMSANLPRLAQSFLANTKAEEPALAALNAYGASTFDVQAQWPGAESIFASLKFARQGEPALSGEVELLGGADGITPGAMAFRAALPLDSLAEILPGGVTCTGAAQATFARTTEDHQFAARVDLTGAGIAVGQYIEKKPGQSAVLDVTGDAAPGHWAPASAMLDLLGETLSARFEEGGVHADDFSVGLGALAALLPEGATARGSIRGSFAAPPASLRLDFDDAGLALTPELAIDSITGGVSYDFGNITVRELRVQGARSDCTLSAGMKNGLWQGTLAGETLDLDALAVFWDMAKALRTDEKSAPAPAASKPLEGEFAIALNHVYFHGEPLEQVRADVGLFPEAIRVPNLALGLGEGAITGTLEMTRAAQDQYGTFAAALSLENVGIEAIDRVAFPEPRGMAGSLSGTVRFSAPVGAGPPVMNAANGAVELEATSGTFGKLGLATKLLTVLRTTEVFSLRLPSFKDTGLVYDTCQTTMAMENGVLTIKQFTLNSPSLELTAAGTVDFPGDATNLGVRANLFEGITGVVSRVPVVGAGVEKMKKVTGLRLSGKGSPYDIKFRVAPGQRVEGLVEKTEQKDETPDASPPQTP